MRRVLPVVLPAGVCAAAFALATASGAGAATAMIGPPNLANTGSTIECGTAVFCSDTMTLAQTGADSFRATAPADGTITSFRVLGILSVVADIRLRVVRPVAGGQYKGVGRSAPGNVTGTPNATSLPIEIGDHIGVDLDGNGGSARIYYAAGSGSTAAWNSPGLAEGSSAPPDVVGALTIMVNATEQLAVPTIAQLGPASGPTTGGGTVVITGDHLANAGEVQFGGTPASFTNVSNTEIHAVAPPGSAGPVDVTVTNIGGTSAGGGPATYTYLPTFGPDTGVTVRLARPQPSVRRVRAVIANANPFEIAGTLAGRTLTAVPVSSRARRVSLGRKRFTVAAGARKLVTLRVPRSLLRSGRRSVRARLTAALRDPAGATRSVSRRVTLRLVRRR
ncbi:MAG TPA: IPT/TIG domain-containing protein [Thermoleophilaceae bacterium]